MTLSEAFKKAVQNGKGRLTAAFRFAGRHWWKLLGVGALAFLAVLMIPSARPIILSHDNPPTPLESNLKIAWKRAAAYNPDAVSVRDGVAYNGHAPLCLDHKPGIVHSAAPIIVLDPGHHYTEFDPSQRYSKRDVHKIVGARSQKNDLTEVDIVDVFAPRLKQELERRGYIVLLTRQPGEVFDLAGGNYAKSLSMRGAMPAFLGEQFGLPVIMISIHVDDVSDGFNVYVQNSTEEKGNKNSFALGRTLAWSYAPNGKAAKLNFRAPEDYKNRGTFLNRALRSFEGIQRQCSPKDRDAAALIELGNIKDAQDLKRLKRMMSNPNDKMASYIANGITNFIKIRYKNDEVQESQLVTPKKAPTEKSAVKSPAKSKPR